MEACPFQGGSEGYAHHASADYQVTNSHCDIQDLSRVTSVVGERRDAAGREPRVMGFARVAPSRSKRVT
jgi:hypothetical protein